MRGIVGLKKILCFDWTCFGTLLKILLLLKKPRQILQFFMLLQNHDRLPLFPAVHTFWANLAKFFEKLGFLFAFKFTKKKKNLFWNTYIVMTFLFCLQDRVISLDLCILNSVINLNCFERIWIRRCKTGKEKSTSIKNCTSFEKVIASIYFHLIFFVKVYDLTNSWLAHQPK